MLTNEAIATQLAGLIAAGDKAAARRLLAWLCREHGRTGRQRMQAETDQAAGADCRQACEL